MFRSMARGYRLRWFREQLAKRRDARAKLQAQIEGSLRIGPFAIVKVGLYSVVFAKPGIYWFPVHSAALGATAIRWARVEARKFTEERK